MTLGRLIELYQAEQQGKQVMMGVYHSGYFESYSSTEEVKITECDLKDLVISEEDNGFRTFFIKDEEDRYRRKLV